MRTSPSPRRPRARHPYHHRAPEAYGGRRVPPARDLFPPVAEMDDEDFLIAGWILAMALVAAVADVVAMAILPALTLPIYTLVIASCVLVIVLAVLAEPEEAPAPPPEPAPAPVRRTRLEAPPHPIANREEPHHAC